MKLSNKGASAPASVAPAAVIAKLPVKAAPALPAPVKATAPAPKAAPAPKPAKLSALQRAIDKAAVKTMNIRRLMAVEPGLSLDALEAELRLAGYVGDNAITKATINTIRLDVLATLRAADAMGRWNGPAIPAGNKKGE